MYDRPTQFIIDLAAQFGVPPEDLLPRARSAHAAFCGAENRTELMERISNSNAYEGTLAQAIRAACAIDREAWAQMAAAGQVEPSQF